MSVDLLASGLQTLIYPYTGDLEDVQRTARGFSSDLTAVVECEKGPFFVKAVRNRPGGRRDSIIREGLINPFVRPISPALRWQAEDDGWIALGFERLRGRSSDFAPGSPDLPAIVDTVGRIGEIGLPGIARDWAETRWNRFARDETDAARFQGNTLLYTDIHPSNFMIGGPDTWAVDWSWPTHGAAFIDPACLVVQLVAAGHRAEAAEAWAGHCEAWTSTDPKAIDVFAAATLRMYEVFVERKPDAAWLKSMVAAAESWTEHRGVTRV
ncbi:phosphotransferase [Streptomyces sp. PSRA5]|uniref:phosphotransferase n=1 Tax=Streptomyces panacea TaxID=3035064 RepID=UPI00339BF0DC